MFVCTKKHVTAVFTGSGLLYLLRLNGCVGTIPTWRVYQLSNNTLKVHKIYSYSDSWKIVKPPIVHLHLFLLLSSSNSDQMAYRETGVSNHSNSFIYTGVRTYSLINKFHTFSKCHQNQGCNLRGVNVRRHSLVCSWVRYMKLVHLVQCSSHSFVLFWLCSVLLSRPTSESLHVVGKFSRYCTQ